MLLALGRGAATHATVLAGTPLLLVGVALHFWAKGCLRQNRVVAMGGPYRFVRHPFYLANALIDAALAIMSGWWLLWIVLPCWWLAVYLPVIRREERWLGEAFADSYQQYKRRVPCLLPWRRGLPPTAEGFSWQNPNIAVEGALARAIRLLAYPLLLLAASDLRAAGLSALADPPRCIAPAMAAAIYLLAWAPAAPQRRASTPLVHQTRLGVHLDGNIEHLPPRAELTGDCRRRRPRPRRGQRGSKRRGLCRLHRRARVGSLAMAWPRSRKGSRCYAALPRSELPQPSRSIQLPRFVSCENSLRCR